MSKTFVSLISGHGSYTSAI